MEKRMIRRERILPLAEPMSFRQLEKEMTSFKTKFKTGVGFSIFKDTLYDNYDGSAYTVVSLICKTPETDREYEYRLKQLKQQELEVERKEQNLYRKLKQKYDNI